MSVFLGWKSLKKMKKLFEIKKAWICVILVWILGLWWDWEGKKGGGVGFGREGRVGSVFNK